MFPTKGRFNSLSGEIADQLPGFAERLHPLRGGRALLLSDLGAVRAAAQDQHRPRRQPRPARRADLRALLPRRHQRRARLPAVLAGAGDPGAAATGRRTRALRSFHIGGNMQVIANIEIEFPIFEKVEIHGVVFFDAGNAYNIEDQYCQIAPFAVDTSKNPCNSPLDIHAYRASWGFGFRWFSPIGPLRFEWGIPFNTLPGEQPDRLRIHDRQLLLISCVKQPAVKETNMTRASRFLIAAAFLLWGSSALAEDEDRLRRPAARPRRDRGRPQGQGQAEEGVRPEAEGARRAAGRAQEETSRTSTRSARCSPPTRCGRRRRSCRAGLQRCRRPTCACSRTCPARSRRRRRRSSSGCRRSSRRSPPPRTSR